VDFIDCCGSYYRRDYLPANWKKSSQIENKEEEK
jgi:hypothetical protein